MGKPVHPFSAATTFALLMTDAILSFLQPSEISWGS